MANTKSSTNPKFSENLKSFKSDLSLSSPGRINLIGEHTDYNQGYVLPTAIDKEIHFRFRRNGTKSSCNVYSETFSEFLNFDLQNLSKSGSSWENYILGVVDEINKRGKILGGFDCIIKSELPIGAGISSSAALECGLATGLNKLFDLQLSKMDIIKVSQDAENNFVGSNCGIMDQYASVMSKKDHLILLDCQSLKAEYIPVDFKNCKILLLNTNVAHNLAESEYNVRREECEEAVSVIQENFPKVNSLRDVDFSMLKECRHNLNNKIYNRSLYVIQENERVLKAAETLKSGELNQFGELMYLSHQGLKNQFEVSCPELDFMVDFSRKFDYILGSRMMGGGFGGCTINLIEEEHIESYIAEISEAYGKEFNIELDAISVLPSEGTVVTENSRD